MKTFFRRLFPSKDAVLISNVTGLSPPTARQQGRLWLKLFDQLYDANCEEEGLSGRDAARKAEAETDRRLIKRGQHAYQ